MNKHETPFIAYGGVLHVALSATPCGIKEAMFDAMPLFKWADDDRIFTTVDAAIGFCERMRRDGATDNIGILPALRSVNAQFMADELISVKP